MSYHYSDPKRADDPHALPNVEVFYVSGSKLKNLGEPVDEFPEDGWYWWSCLPGCLPDGEANGPFSTEEEALEDAQEDSDAD